ncbi:MAG: hypothetical protein IIV80_01770 [Clostridia bacterium]|nr:hypothetical protein [Clostridia bacterium]
MHIYLMIDHTALLEDDHRPTVTVEPACSGVLEIEGHPMRVAPTGTVLPPIRDKIGHVRVIFTSDRGVTYTAIRPHIVNGVPVSRPDYAVEYARLLIRTDQMAREVERLTEELHKLSADSKHDALGFMTKNIKHTEV